MSQEAQTTTSLAVNLFYRALNGDTPATGPKMVEERATLLGLLAEAYRQG